MKKRIITLILTLSVIATACSGSDKSSERERRHSDREDSKQTSLEEEDSQKTDQDLETKQTESSSSEDMNVEEVTPKPVIDSSKFKVSHIGAFTSKDMDGNEVNESIFKNADYTMINLWGTFCGPCINEMPELEEIHQSLPDNIQMIGIVSDVYPDYDYSLQDAKDIISETGVTYTNIMCTYDLSDEFANLMYVPTTIFVDSEGNVVCEVIEGADIQAYKDQIAKLSGN